MKYRLIVVCAALAIALVACGGDDETADTADSAPDTATTEPVTDTETETPSSTAASPTTVAESPDTTEAEATETTAEESPATTTAGADGVLDVPADFESIQAAVDAAAPGDLILIAPGTYHEAVDVGTDELTIRGLDRDTVILDGEFELDNAIRVLGAQDVAVENLTTMNYTNNGVFWVGSSGYRASYITTYRTGDYGIYAFDSTNGLIEHSHTMGSFDAGVYVGQCYPCDAVIRNVESSNNGLGYSGTNSGGNLLIVNSSFHNNRAGIVPNSGSYELCYPERETTIVGNLVYDNNEVDTPAIDFALLAQGNGILLAGGINNVIERNRVDDHNRTGIGLVPFPEEFPNDDMPTEDEWATPCSEQKNQPVVVPEGALLWDSIGNRVFGNLVTNSREADLATASVGGDISTFRNCFSDNEFTTSAPIDLELLAPCDGAGNGGDWTAGDLNVIRWLDEQADLPGSIDWREAPLPELGTHENMPDAATAPPAAAVGMPPTVDLAAIQTPELP
jgi:hypothetical protein